MQTGEVVLPAVLAVVLVTAGCASLAPAGTPEASPTATPTADASPTATPSPTPAPVASLPSPDGCATGALPRPGTTEGVDPATYPTPPGTVNETTVARYAAAFEEAYFHNHQLDREARVDDDMNLTGVDVSTEVRNVSRTTDGYLVRLAVTGATWYERGIHGDHWVDAAYFVNETTVVRQQLSSGDAVAPEMGTRPLHCEQ